MWSQWRALQGMDSLKEEGFVDVCVHSVAQEVFERIRGDSGQERFIPGDLAQELVEGFGLQSVQGGDSARAA